MENGSFFNLFVKIVFSAKPNSNPIIKPSINLNDRFELSIANKKGINPNAIIPGNTTFD